jgi:small-conductance mechanosensitive channel
MLLILSLAGLGIAALLGSSTVLAMLKGAIVLLALSLAGLGVAALMGGAVLVLKGAVVLAFFIWVATVASRRYGHGFWPRSDLGDIGYSVAIEVVRKPLLALLVVLGLGVTGIVSSIFLIVSILAFMGVCVALGRRVEGVRDTVRKWRHAPRKGRVAHAGGAMAATQLPRSKLAIGGSRPINNREHLLEADGPIEELRLFVRLSHRTDEDTAAELAVKAIAAARETSGTPAPVCLSRSATDGSAVLELQFHVCNLQRGREHVLDEARSNIWDALHDHRIAFTFPAYDRVARHCPSLR